MLCDNRYANNANIYRNIFCANSMTTGRNYSHLTPHPLEFLRVVTEFVGILVEILYGEFPRTYIFECLFVP